MPGHSPLFHPRARYDTRVIDKDLMKRRRRLSSETVVGTQPRQLKRAASSSKGELQGAKQLMAPNTSWCDTQLCDVSGGRGSGWGGRGSGTRHTASGAGAGARRWPNHGCALGIWNLLAPASCVMRWGQVSAGQAK